METEELPLVAWSEFLSQVPPNKTVLLNDAFSKYPYSSWPEPNRAETLLWCPTKTCNAHMLFEYVDHKGKTDSDGLSLLFMTYQCKHCETTLKRFAMLIEVHPPSQWKATKLGERPPFGPHVPARVLRLIQEDAEHFLQGWRAESLNLGVGAFAYYRRVVENQKERLFDGIISAAKRLGSKPEDVAGLERAKANFQFSQSVEDFKTFLPSSMLIKGHNPLLLLHDALSKGIHSQSDSECLSLATVVRVLLTDLAERIAEALREKTEVEQAVARLMKKNDGTSQK